MNINLPLLVGCSREGRRSIHVARYLHERLARAEGIASPWLDLGDYDFPIMEERMQEMEQIPDDLLTFSKTLADADAILIVTPEYKNGYPGVLKNALDYLPAGIFRRKPIGIATVSSGGFGGINCLAQLRLVCLAMGGLPIPPHLAISNVREWFSDEGALLNPKLDARADEFLEELLWYAEALAGVGAERSLSAL